MHFALAIKGRLERGKVFIRRRDVLIDLARVAGVIVERVVCLSGLQPFDDLKNARNRALQSSALPAGKQDALARKCTRICR